MLTYRLELNMVPGTRHAKGYLDDVFNETVDFLKRHVLVEHVDML